MQFGLFLPMHGGLFYTDNLFSLIMDGFQPLVFRQVFAHGWAQCLPKTLGMFNQNSNKVICFYVGVILMDRYTFLQNYDI